MTRIHFLCSLVCIALALSSEADTIVAVGATLAVTNSESLNLGLAPVQLGTGSTLVFPGASAGGPGINEYMRTNAVSYGVPGVAAYSNWVRCATNIYWAGTNITSAQTEYIYTARWYVPQTGTYS